MIRASQSEGWVVTRGSYIKKDMLILYRQSLKALMWSGFKPLHRRD